jgi:hypothetical protein
MELPKISWEPLYFPNNLKSSNGFYVYFKGAGGNYWAGYTAVPAVVRRAQAYLGSNRRLSKVVQYIIRDL